MTRIPIVIVTVGLLLLASPTSATFNIDDIPTLPQLGDFELPNLLGLWNFDFSDLAEAVGINMTQIQIQCALCVGNCSTFTTYDVPMCMGECSSCPPISPPQRFDYSSMITEINEPACTAGYAETPFLAPRATERQKKNIIVFMMDDLDVTATPYFDVMPFAKKLFVDNGVHFENAFTSTSICCAARCQFLTGLYGHNVGIVGNGGLFGGWDAFVKPLNNQGTRQLDEDGKCINNEDRTVAKYLHDWAGYKTAIFGKLMNGIENETSHVIRKIMPGWTQFDIPGDRSFYAGYAYSLSNYNEDDDDFSMKYYGTKAKDYSTDVLTLKTLKFLARYRNDPMFVYIGNGAPHFPLAAAPRHKGLQYNWQTKYEQYIANRENYGTVTNQSVPTWFAASRNARNNVMGTGWVMTEWVKRMGSLYAVDDQIRATYQAVSALGLLDNTVFVLVGDNGYNMGAHDLIHKQAPYEECIRVPLYMSGAGLRRGATVTSKAMLMDLLPTFLDFANLEAPDYVDGVSLYEHVVEGGSPIEFQRDMYLQYRQWTPSQGDGPGIATEFLPSIMYSAPAGFALDVPPYHGLRTDQYLYVEWDYRSMNLSNPAAAVSVELYDVVSDPYQLFNLAYLPEYSSLVAELHTNMTTLGDCTGCSCYPRNHPDYCPPENI